MIILTGVSGGVGKKIFKGLSKIDNIIGIYNSNKPSFNFLSKKCSIQKIDLLNESTITSFIDTFLTKEKKITLIHLASLKSEKLLINYDINDIKNEFDVNFFAPTFFSKKIIPIMAANNWGRIIFFSSTGGEKGDIGTASYTASKMSLLGLSRVISIEYAKFNITSNVIRLGNFDTGMYKKLSKDKQKELLKLVPSKKLGNFKDIVTTIKMIIDSDYINNTEVNIDGGMRR